MSAPHRYPIGAWVTPIVGGSAWLVVDFEADDIVCERRFGDGVAAAITLAPLQMRPAMRCEIPR